MDSHFHTPSPKETRFAVGVDMLLHGKGYRMFEAPTLARCAKCGRVIEEPKSAKRLHVLLTLLWLLLYAAIVLLVVLKPTLSHLLLYSILLVYLLLTPVILLFPHLLVCFGSWPLVPCRDREELAQYIRRHTEKHAVPRYPHFSVVPLICWLSQIALFIAAIILEAS